MSLLSASPRHSVASAFGALVLFGVVGCARTVVPTPAPPVLAPPITAPAPLPVSPAVVRYAVPMLITDTRYRLESTTALERDSAGRRDKQQLLSQAQMVVRLRRRPNGDLGATGRLFGYTVQSALSTTPVAIDSLGFDAILDSLALRVAAQPPLMNECDRPETGALGMVRDVLLRVPASVAVGDRWRDSTVGLVCRSGLPMIVRTSADYIVLDTARAEDGLQLVLRRTSTSHLEGKLSSPWRTVDVVGSGTATLDANVSVLSGAVNRVHSTSILTLTATDRTVPTAVRAQQVTQRVTLTGSIIAK